MKSGDRRVAGRAGDTALRRTVAPEKRACKWYERGTGKQGLLLLPGWRYCVWEGCKGYGNKEPPGSISDQEVKGTSDKTPRKKGLAFRGTAWKELIRKRSESLHQMYSNNSMKIKSPSSNRWPGSPDSSVTKISQGLTIKQWEWGTLQIGYFSPFMKTKPAGQKLYYIHESGLRNPFKRVLHLLQQSAVATFGICILSWL